MCEKEEELPNRGALREVPLMGVIYVVHEASKLGFYNGNPEVRGSNDGYANCLLKWANLGQGQPEVILQYPNRIGFKCRFLGWRNGRGSKENLKGDYRANGS